MLYYVDALHYQSNEYIIRIFVHVFSVLGFVIISRL